MFKITKYKNRKLYNSTTRSYTTLAQVLELHAQGVHFKVTDHKTKNDITGVIVDRAKVVERLRSLRAAELAVGVSADAVGLA